MDESSFVTTRQEGVGEKPAKLNRINAIIINMLKALIITHTNQIGPAPLSSATSADLFNPETTIFNDFTLEADQ